MTSELILKSDVLDILFENRNKDYGAYMLRKFYNDRLIKSIVIMMSTVIGFTALTFLPETSVPNDFFVEEQRYGTASPKPTVPAVKKQIKKQTKVTPRPTQKFVNTIIIVQNKDSADILPTLKDGLIDSKTVIFPDNPEIQTTFSTGSGIETDPAPLKATESVIDNTTPLLNPEIMPQFPGGMEALRRFLIKNLRNPETLENWNLVSVKVQFVVGYDGKLQRFEFDEEGGREFNNEVIRVLKKMPAWIPGKSNGKDVSVYYTIPVKFVRED